MRIKNYTQKEYISEKRRFIQEYDPWFEDYWSKNQEFGLFIIENIALGNTIEKYNINYEKV